MSNKLFGHYTSQPGLIGIISNQVIWATNIKFLNDEHEFQDALNLIQELLKKSKITPDHKDHPLYVKFLEQLNKKLNTLDNYVTESIFTFSFSKEKDLLSQWRGYCTENNGYCIVFEIDSLFEEIKSSYDDAYLVDCVYEIKNKEKLLKDLLNSCWRIYTKAESDKERKSIMDDFADDLMLLASHFKHPSFSEEKEKRIVVFSEFDQNAGHKFREGRFSIIPYIELPARRNFIKEIYIGPTSNKELTKRALEMFLENAFGFPPSLFGDLSVHYSKTPYRPW